MNLFWTGFEYFTNLLESFLITDFISRFLGFRYKGLQKFLSFAGIIFIVFANTTITNSITYFEGIAVFIPFLLNFVYALFFLKGKPIMKLFISTISMIIIILVNAMTFFFTSMATGVNIQLLMSQSGTYRFIVILITKLVFFYVTRIILKYKGQKEISVKWTDWIYVIVIPVTSIFTIISLIQVAFVTKNSEHTTLLIAVFGIVVTNVVTYFLFGRINRDNHLQTENLLLQQQYDNQRKYMAEIQTLNQEIRILHHDMNNHFLCISSFLEKQNYQKATDYINGICKKIDVTNKVVLTGDEAIDCIVNCKLEVARQAGIKVTSSISCDKKAVEDIDISIILGNLIDNAIEACAQAEIEKSIWIEIYNNQSYLIITVKNSINETVLQKKPIIKNKQER